MNNLKLPYCYKHLSLDYIIDNNNIYIYWSGHTSINPNQLAMLESLLQVWISEIEKAVQQQLAIEKANWAQEAVLENQVEELQQQLANAQMHLGLQQKYTYILSLLIIMSKAVLTAFKIISINLRTWAVVF